MSHTILKALLQKRVILDGFCKRLYRILCFMKLVKIFVAGHQGMVGSALLRTLRHHPEVVLVTRPRTELDLRDAQAVSRFFAQ